MARPQQAPRARLEEFIENISLEAMGDRVSTVFDTMENQGFMAAANAIWGNVVSDWNAMDTANPISLNPQSFPLKANCFAAQQWINNFSEAQSDVQKRQWIERGLGTKPIKDLLTVFRCVDDFNNFSQMPIFNQNRFREIHQKFVNIFNRALNEVGGLEGFRDEYNALFTIPAEPAARAAAPGQPERGSDRDEAASAAAQEQSDYDRHPPSPGAARRAGEQALALRLTGAKLEEKKRQ